MPALNEDQRAMTIQTPLDDHQPLFRLMWFSGREAISYLFRFRLDLEVQNHRENKVDFGKLLGEEIHVVIPLPDGKSRHVHGVCAGLSRTGSDDHAAHYTMELVPKLWLLTRKSDCRVFQKKSVPKIIRDVFEQLKIDFEPLKSESKYPERDYCVQYNETDAQFISRLMEEEGIHFFFRHSAEGHKVVLMDASARIPSVPAPSRIDYGANEQAGRGDLRIDSWRKLQRLTPGKRALRDYSMHKPQSRWEIERPIVHKVNLGQTEHPMHVRASKDLEVFQYPGEYAHRLDRVDGTDGERDRTAVVRADQLALPGLRVNGSSNCPNLMCGHSFFNVDILQEHQADGEYLLTAVEHTARPLGLKQGQPYGMDYHNKFSCIPADLKFQPQRLTSKPEIHGVQTAVVVGPKSNNPKNKEEIHVDKFGRIKVRFHWDRTGLNDERCSAWIRVGQGWASGGFGMHFWPRVGDEVIVAFENGDPDKPIVVGSVYNHDNMPPYSLPEEKTKSGVKTKSVKDGNVRKHYNELRFEDKKGLEQIYLRAERNLDAVIESSETRKIGWKRKTTIGEKKSTKEDAKKLVEDIEVNGSRLVFTQGSNSLFCEGSYSAFAFGGHSCISCEDLGIESLQGNVTVRAMKSIELSVGVNSIKINPSGIWINGLNLALKGQLCASMHAPSTSVTADGTTTVNAPLTNILSTGPLILKGAAAGITY